jgi:hypothetical protein
VLKAAGCLTVGFVVVGIGAINLAAGVLAMVIGMAICREFFSP